MKSGSIVVNKPIGYNNATIYQSGFGQAVQMRVSDANGNVLFDDSIPIGIYRSTMNPDAPAGIVELKGLNASLYVIAPDDNPANMPQLDTLNLKSGQMFVQIRDNAGSNGQMPPSQVVEQGQPIDLAGLNIDFVRERRFTVLQVAYNPGIPVFIFASILLVGASPDRAAGGVRIGGVLSRLRDRANPRSAAGVDDAYRGARDQHLSRTRARFRWRWSIRHASGRICIGPGVFLRHRTYRRHKTGTVQQYVRILHRLYLCHSLTDEEILNEYTYITLPAPAARRRRRVVAFRSRHRSRPVAVAPRDTARSSGRRPCKCSPRRHLGRRGHGAGLALVPAVVVGLAIALSSSVAIVNITRSRRRTTDPPPERAMLGWSVVQDVTGVVLAAIVIVALRGESETLVDSLIGFAAFGWSPS